MNHGAVAQPAGLMGVRGLQQPPDFLHIEKFRQGFPLLRRAQMLGRIVYRRTFADEEGEEVADGCDMPRNRAVAQAGGVQTIDPEAEIFQVRSTTPPQALLELT